MDKMDNRKELEAQIEEAEKEYNKAYHNHRGAMEEEKDALDDLNNTQACLRQLKDNLLKARTNLTQAQMEKEEALKAKTDALNKVKELKDKLQKLDPVKYAVSIFDDSGLIDSSVYESDVSALKQAVHRWECRGDKIIEIIIMKIENRGGEEFMKLGPG